MFLTSTETVNKNCFSSLRKMDKQTGTPYGQLQKNGFPNRNHFKFHLHNNNKLSNKKERTHEKNVNKRIK